MKQEYSMTNLIKSLMIQVKKINEKYDALQKLNCENFNLFSILNMERKEVETHSLFIYELLNPNGSHNQGDTFLKLFLSDVLKISNKKYKEIKSVHREDVTKNSKRIDFTIETNQHQIGIEMKIDAKDQENQLSDYYFELQSRAKSSQEVKLYYLTLTGHEASKKSTQNKLTVNKNYHLISFEVQILNWLQKCIEKSATISILREGLIQYSNLIQKLTNKLSKNMEEEVEGIIKDAKDVEALQTIYNEYPSVWAKKEMEFWNTLWEQIKDICDQYEFEPFDTYWYDEDGLEYQEEQIIKNIMDARSKTKSPFGFGINKIINNDISVHLYFEEWGSGISIYIVFSNKREKHIMNDSIEKLCSSMDFTRKDGDMRYKYSEVKIIFFRKGQTNPTYDIFNNDKFQEYVNKLSNEIYDIIIKINKKQQDIVEISAL